MATIKQYNLRKLDCASCAEALERDIQQLPGVNFVSINFSTAKLHLDAEDIESVKEFIRKSEPDLVVTSTTNGDKKASRFTSPAFIRILLSGLLLLIGLMTVTQRAMFVQYLVFGAAYLLTGLEVLVNAGRNIRRGNWFDETFLMSISTLGAMAIGELPEAVTVMLFYQIGEFVQGWSVDNTRQSLNALMDIRPETASVQRDGRIMLVKPEDVEIGEIIVVRPGERIPLDGTVIEGESHLDTSALTGESRPRMVSVGEPVLSGTVNQSSMLTIRVDKTFGQSSVNKLLDLVEHASERKSRTQRFITRFAQIYTPVVVGLALLVAFLPPLFIPGASLQQWVYRALILLVISCPCALVISIPIGYFGGIGAASQHGILVKGANFLDVLADVKTVVFDKTGTLTRGVFKVTHIVPQEGWRADELLSYAAQAEQHSNHPVAKSILQAYGTHQPLKQVSNSREYPGFGLIAEVEGKTVVVGTDALLHRQDISHAACELSGAAVHVAVDGQYIGYLTVSDEIKADSSQAITELKHAGIHHTAMLTGDQLDEAQRVAEALALDEYKAELLPDQKLQAVEEMLKGPDKAKVAFVGDGINDAPVLARADVGIAMGALGSDAAIETADVVIMTDSPAKVPQAIRIARHTRAIVYQNIMMAFVVKGLFILLGIWGLAGMWQAVFADVGVTLLAVLNATRVMRAG